MQKFGQVSRYTEHLHSVWNNKYEPSVNLNVGDIEYENSLIRSYNNCLCYFSLGIYA
jgi:hypothetical protein